VPSQHVSRPKPRLPPYLVLLRVGFALPTTLLRRRCALTAPFHPYPNLAAEAVCFLWYFPSTGLDPGLPDVIRHTALRSSDFPLPPSEDVESDRPVQLPTRSLYSMGSKCTSNAERSSKVSFTSKAKIGVMGNLSGQS